MEGNTQFGASVKQINGSAIKYTKKVDPCDGEESTRKFCKTICLVIFKRLTENNFGNPNCSKIVKFRMIQYQTVKQNVHLLVEYK